MLSSRASEWDEHDRFPKGGSIAKLGLYDTVVELEPGKLAKLFVWGMPAVE